MTRKDYEAIAEVIERLAEKYRHDEGRHIVAEFAEDIAEVMTNDNPRFNRDTFYRACGYQEV
jgi:hypothetical protein